jgi:alpha-amylase/alpha-mannosidase (GH57 family)
MKVALLWHMHQPSYWEADLGRYRYPWAFLHAARHYQMMGLLAREHPDVAMTINVTPVLLEQLADYSKESFRDQLLDVVRKPADALDSEEIGRLLDHAFKLNAPTMIVPFPRYRELKNLLDGTRAKRVRPEELLDLQVWYLLTWSGPHLRQRPEIAELFRKGKQFTEEDKEMVFRELHDAVRSVIPVYRELGSKGRVEISTTPYFHPILPLIIDCEVARESRPGVHLDEVGFRFPQDARWHVQEAISAYEGYFGKAPTGMWPAEGSVSDAALDLLASCGLRWAATDEAVLARSLGKFPLSEEERHRPYAFGDGSIRVFFRDRELSDRIGFVYSSWDPDHAAEDLLGRLRGIRERLGRKESSACVSIILDGENPWEYYPDSGVGFLRRFYRGLATTPGIESVRMGDLEAFDRKLETLSHVVPGSWIDANFDTWIGAEAKNRAWACLGSARQKLATEAPHMPVPREFYRAEGSDWFWWLGPGHDTPYEASYENLFRTNLIAGLAKAGLEAPAVLRVERRIVHSPLFQPPLHLFTPRISGKLGNYYDWIAAGYYKATEGTTHRTSRLIDILRFGFDEKSFYLRTEGNFEAVRTSKEGVALVIEFHNPRSLQFVLQGGRLHSTPWPGNGAAPTAGASAGGAGAMTATVGPRGSASAGAEGLHQDSAAQAALDAVAEAGIPLEELGGQPGDFLDFAVSLRVGQEALDRLPASGFISVAVPSMDFGGENWSV